MRWRIALVVLFTLLATPLAFCQGSGYLAPQGEQQVGTATSVSGPAETAPVPPAAPTATVTPTPRAQIEPYPGRDEVERHVMAARSEKPARDGHDGRPGRNGRNGRDGKDGKDGRDGRDGRDAPVAQPNTNITPAPTATAGGERETGMPWYWILLIVVGGLSAIVGIASWLVRNGQEHSENLATGRIPGRRMGMAAPNAPAPLGPTTGDGGALHYDSRGRVVGWERWQYPAQGAVQMVPAGTPAMIVTYPGQPANLVVLPQPVQPAPHANQPPLIPAGQPTPTQQPAAPPAGELPNPEAAAQAGANA